MHKINIFNNTSVLNKLKNAISEVLYDLTTNILSSDRHAAVNIFLNKLVIFFRYS